MENKIKEKISEYLSFNIDEIINNDIDNTYIFGGAIRDIIANKEIHDIDILTLPESMYKIQNILDINGYKLNQEVGKIDIHTMYQDVHCIFEPKNWIKIVNNEIRLVQLIRPAIMHNIDQRIFDYKSIVGLKEKLYYLLGQVDISVCGVHYSYDYGLKESIKGAIIQCQNNMFELITDTEMSSEMRLFKREHKLLSRNWKKIDEQKRKILNRILKLEKIINTKSYYMNPNRIKNLRNKNI